MGKKTAAFTSCIAAQFSYLLPINGRDLGLGWCLGVDCGYKCFSDDRQKVCKPDASFIGGGRFLEERVPDGYVTTVPDLTVEVASSKNSFYEVETKVEEYLQAGFPLVWVVNPRVRTIHIYCADGTVQRLQEDAVLTAPELLLGLRCRVADRFTLTPTG